MEELAEARHEDIVNSIARMLEESYDHAKQYGDIIGRVSRYSKVIVSEYGEVEFDVEPSIYYSQAPKAIHRIGEYIVIVDPKTKRLVLLRVTAIERADTLAILSVEPPVSGFTNSIEPSGLLTITKIKAKALLEVDPESGEEPVPATISIEPQSPVIDPKPEVLARLLALKDEPGPILGSLATPSGIVKGGKIRVKLPYRVLLQHTLIVGTTGSGKTTLLKNIIASIYSNWRAETPIVVVVDMNQDFIQLPLKPETQPLDPIALNAYMNVKPPTGLVIVTPIPARIVESITDKYNVTSPLDIASHAMKIYYEDSIQPLTQVNMRGLPTCKVRDHRSIVCEGKAPWGSIVFIPYFINTLRLDSDKLASLMPGLTEAARDLLNSIRKGFIKESDANIYPPIHAIIASLKAYSEGIESKYLEKIIKSSKDIVASKIIAKGFNYESIIVSEIENLGHTLLEAIKWCLEIIEYKSPHGETVKALYRRLLSLLDSEIVDVAITDKTGRINILEEPKWESIITEAENIQAPIVLDLKWPIDKGLGGLEEPRMAAYRMLQSLIEWKHSLWAKRSIGRSILVVIDEAHQFFPQERGAREEQEASRQIATMISRLARIGRARGVGLIFSTHSPRDVHDIILQLANTKIILRTESHHLERINVPGEVREVAPRLPDRLAAVVSHVFRGGYIYTQTTTPLTAHYDISYQLFKIT
ncbi:MAG: ATP-binding protein [Acidilobaceae archaeon]